MATTTRYVDAKHGTWDFLPPCRACIACGDTTENHWVGYGTGYDSHTGQEYCRECLPGGEGDPLAVAFDACDGELEL